MLMTESRLKARMDVVDEHVRCENLHGLDAVMATFGKTARYDDEPCEDHRIGHDGVRAYYSDLMRALPDLSIEVNNRHAASDSIILEVTIRGTHLGLWRGLPGTGRALEISLCGIFTFDSDDRLAGERIYYDRVAVLRQLGVFSDPSKGFGRVISALTHPLTIARAYLRYWRISVASW
jgi:steroid delta-isomerase-like uncharacterized protein